MISLRYSFEASDDLAQIWEYCADATSIDVAREMINKIHRTIQHTLVRFPRSGRLRPEHGRHVRSFPVPPYVIFSIGDKRDVYVLRVLHGHRDIRAPLMSLLTAV